MTVAIQIKRPLADIEEKVVEGKRLPFEDGDDVAERPHGCLSADSGRLRLIRLVRTLGTPNAHVLASCDGPIARLIRCRPLYIPKQSKARTRSY